MRVTFLFVGYFWRMTTACAVKYCVGVFVILTQSKEVQLKGRPHRPICPLARCGYR